MLTVPGGGCRGKGCSLVFEPPDSGPQKVAMGPKCIERVFMPQFFAKQEVRRRPPPLPPSRARAWQIPTRDLVEVASPASSVCTQPLPTQVPDAAVQEAVVEAVEEEEVAQPSAPARVPISERSVNPMAMYRGRKQREQAARDVIKELALEALRSGAVDTGAMRCCWFELDGSQHQVTRPHPPLLVLQAAQQRPRWSSASSTTSCTAGPARHCTRSRPTCSRAL